MFIKKHKFTLPSSITYGEKYGRFFALDNKKDIKEYFKAGIRHLIQMDSTITVREAIDMEKTFVYMFSSDLAKEKQDLLYSTLGIDRAKMEEDTLGHSIGKEMFAI